MRRIVACAVTFAVLAAIAPARAQHCSPIRLLSKRQASVDVGDVGCAAPGDADTDLVLPASSHVVVQWLAPSEPTDGSRITFAGIDGPLSVCDANGDCVLTFERIAGGWESRQFSLAPTGSATGRARVRVCAGGPGDGPTVCAERTYRTVTG